MTKLKKALLAASIWHFSLLNLGAEIVLTQVNSTSVTIGSDSFLLSSANNGTAFFFGSLQNTADMASFSPLQYFQADTPLLPINSYEGPTVAYVFSSTPGEGATNGINFSAYDLNQDGVAETLFMLDFGSDVLDFSDDLILAYATETEPILIDLSSAKTQLLKLLPLPDLTVETAIMVSFLSMSGSTYTIEKSTDLEVWTDAKTNIEGDGTIMKIFFEITNPKTFYRLKHSE